MRWIERFVALLALLLIALSFALPAVGPEVERQIWPCFTVDAAPRVASASPVDALIVMDITKHRSGEPRDCETVSFGVFGEDEFGYLVRLKYADESAAAAGAAQETMSLPQGRHRIAVRVYPSETQSEGRIKLVVAHRTRYWRISTDLGSVPLPCLWKRRATDDVSCADAGPAPG